MKYNIDDNEITFEVETEHPGKWAIIDALKQVLEFWKKVRYYAVFRRQPFNSIIIKIKVPDWLSIRSDTKRKVP